MKSSLPAESEGDEIKLALKDLNSIAKLHKPVEASKPIEEEKKAASAEHNPNEMNGQEN